MDLLTKLRSYRTSEFCRFQWPAAAKFKVECLRFRRVEGRKYPISSTFQKFFWTEEKLNAWMDEQGQALYKHGESLHMRIYEWNKGPNFLGTKGFSGEQTS